jgi:hypothetical protein
MHSHIIGMPLFIRSLPLSLFTFWRYLAILPLIAIFAFLFSLLSFLPVAGLFVPGIVSAGLLIVGLRCALAARGHRNPLDHGTLLTVSAIFCVIFIGTDIFVYGASWLVLWTITQAGVELDPIGLLAGLFGVSAYWSGILLALLAPAAIVKAAFAVPMVGAAYAASPKGGDINYFSGLGKGMFSLLLVMAVWLLGGHIFSIFGEVWAVFGMIAFAIWDLMSGETLTWELMPAVPFVLGGVLVMTWASSWFFATAVLAWEDVVSRRMADAERQRNAARPSTEDIRALRRSRM